MERKYIDLIEQTFEFPQEEFDVHNNELYFNNIHVAELIKQYGTPLKITYLPKISEQIQKAKRLFNVAIAKADYKGKYHYSYCTKSSHFSFVMDEVLKNNVHLETSSAFDINIIETLHEQGRFDKNSYIICNGFKRPQYLENIHSIIEKGFENTISILDNKEEFDTYTNSIKKAFKLGIRVATEQEPQCEFYTSRLGFKHDEIISFYKERIKSHKNAELKMLHFFINTGINDTTYYWNEFTKCVNIYCKLKKICPELEFLNIGGGFPIKNSLSFNFDYEKMSEEIILKIKHICKKHNVPEPNIFTEFGSYTVGESNAIFYSILDQKKQNDKEIWNMIDSSFITTLPDSWAIKKRFILLAINNWDHNCERVFLGGLTCDSQDFYHTDSGENAIYLPEFRNDKPQYIGLFHTGAYQESIGGFGGIQHCLIPAPKHVIIDMDNEGEITTKLFAKEQSYKSMMKTLGY